jgi:hypothetical protein
MPTQESDFKIDKLLLEVAVTCWRRLAVSERNGATRGAEKEGRHSLKPRIALGCLPVRSSSRHDFTLCRLVSDQPVPMSREVAKGKVVPSRMI